MVFGFLRRRREDAAPASCRERVDVFWRWFAAHEGALHEGLQSRSLDARPLAEAIARVHPSLAWELCPSPEEGREGLAFSGEGSVPLRILARYVARCAPALRRFTVFASKQPSEGVSGMSTRLGDGETLPLGEMRFSVAFDEERERVDVTCHHPAFPRVPERDRTQLTFIALDNVLGENLVEAWIGTIEATVEPTDAQRHDVDALLRQVHAALSLHGLDPGLDPTDRWWTYSTSETGDGDVVARADVVSGSTCVLDLIRSLRRPDHEDELAPAGGCFAYVMFPAAGLTRGREVEERGRVSDLLEEALAAGGAGEVIGGAHGLQYAYVDLVLWDERAAIDAIRSVVAQGGVVERASLRYFAPGRSDEHVPLTG